MNKSLIFFLFAVLMLQACTESYTVYPKKTSDQSLPKKSDSKTSPLPTSPTAPDSKDPSPDAAVDTAAPAEESIAAPKPFKPIEFESNVTIQIGGQDRTFKVEVPNEDNIEFQKDVHDFFVDLLAYQADAAKAEASHSTDKKTTPDKMKELAAQEDKWKKEMAAEELKSENELLKLFNTFWKNLTVGRVLSNQFVTLPTTPTTPTGTIEIKTDVGGISATAENDSSGVYYLINRTNPSSPTSPTIAQALKDAIDNLLMSLVQKKQQEIMVPAPTKLLAADMTDTASTIRMRHAETGHIDLRQSFGGIADYKSPLFVKISGDDNMQKTSGTSGTAMYKFNGILVGMTHTCKNDTKQQSETSVVSIFVFDKAFLELQQGMVSINDAHGTRQLVTLGYDIDSCFTPFIQLGARQLQKNNFSHKESRTFAGATVDIYNEKNDFIKYSALIGVKGGMNATHMGQNRFVSFETHLSAQTKLTSYDGVTFSTGAELSTTLDSKLKLSVGFTH